MSKLSVINQALSELQEERITQAQLDAAEAAEADALDRANEAVLQWEEALREFLRLFPWSWAKATDELTAASPAPAFGWEVRFPLPDDFVSLVSLNEELADDVSDTFEIQSGYLHTDSTEAKIEYIYFPTDTGLDTFLERMDGEAARAFVFLLAARMAPKLAKDGGNASDRLEAKHRVKLSAARTRNGNEQKPQPKEPAAESMFDRARYGDQAG